MRVYNKVPPHACRRAAFDGKQPKAGEKVIELNINVEDLPMQGSICLLERHIRQAMQKLHIAEADPEIEAKLEAAAIENARLRELVAGFEHVAELKERAGV